MSEDHIKKPMVLLNRVEHSENGCSIKGKERTLESPRRFKGSREI